MGMGQRRTTEITRGLFAVRYVGADDSAQPPRVIVSAEPNSAAYVDVILHPDHEEAVLSHPGTCLIVRAMRPGQLAIEVEPSQTNGSIAATVNIEPLIQREAALSAGRPQQQRDGTAWRRSGSRHSASWACRRHRRRPCKCERMACGPDCTFTHRRNFD